MTSKLTGRVIRSQSGFFTVETEAGNFIAQIPGRLKQEKKLTDLVTIGDWVEITPLDEKTAVIESVAEREQVLVANPDQVVFVFSIRKPASSLRKLDRFLVVAEMNELPAVICVNKMDLARPGEAEALFGLYADIGYPVIYTSAKTGQGIDDLRDQLTGNISVLAGSSGVGKSSLLNAIQPGLGLQVRSVSAATEKGLHTTRYAELFPLAGGGYVADTPGIRGLALFDVESEELDGYFREIAPLVADCRFSDCTHVHEPGCAVKQAVENGRVAVQRYESYLRLREEHEALEDELY